MDVYFDNSKQEFREVAEKVRDDMYVDDLVIGEESITEFKKLKSDLSIYSSKGGLSYVSGIPTKQY